MTDDEEAWLHYVDQVFRVWKVLSSLHFEAGKFENPATRLQQTWIASKDDNLRRVRHHPLQSGLKMGALHYSALQP